MGLNQRLGGENLKKKYIKECADHAAMKGIVKEEWGEGVCQGRRLQRTLEMKMQKFIKSHGWRVE